MGKNNNCGPGGCSPNALRRAPADGEVVNKPCCGGKDLGPMRDDEGPSEADIARFGDVTQTCPKCKSELYDDTEICWKCGHAFTSGGHKAVPKWAMIGIVAVSVAFIAVMLVR
ncbi:MAG: hypothetical protein H7210_13830 [Pyrinomonadaceae bacterium]|nr:hypothetical protein [Phycisphaerales bacterium]